MEEAQELWCDTRSIQTNLDYLREFLFNILPRKLSKLSDFLCDVRVEEERPIGGMARFQLVDKARPWPNHGGNWVRMEMMWIHATRDGERLELDLGQSMGTCQFCKAVLDIIDQRWPALLPQEPGTPTARRRKRRYEANVWLCAQVERHPDKPLSYWEPEYKELRAREGKPLRDDQDVGKIMQTADGLDCVLQRAGQLIKSANARCAYTARATPAGQDVLLAEGLGEAIVDMGLTVDEARALLRVLGAVRESVFECMLRQEVVNEVRGLTLRN